MFNMRSLNFYLIIIGATFILDQAGKYLIIKTMTWGQSVPVFLNVFHITYVRNTGAAFSSLQDQRWLLISVTSLVILIIFSYIIKRYKLESVSLLVSFALIIGGGIGNLTDRIRFGYVVDFLDFRIWPVFNIADIAVVTGCLLMIFSLFKKERRDGK